MFARFYTKVTEFGSKSTARKILYAMIDITNLKIEERERGQSDQIDSQKLSTKIKKFDELVVALSEVLEELLNYQQYQNATKEDQRAIRLAIAKQLLWDSSFLYSKFKRNGEEKIGVGLQNNYKWSSDNYDAHGYSETYRAFSVSFPAAFLDKEKLKEYIRPVVKDFPQFAKNTMSISNSR